VEAGDKVLEVGTGSGYQAAVLAELGAMVVSVERVLGLEERARRVLERLGYTRVRVYPAGEQLGWPAEAPYDAILVTAAAPRVPPPLVEQLKEAGRLVIPVGTRESQELLQVRKVEGRLQTRSCGPCRFVPLVGAGAWGLVPSPPADSSG
jgi:protein-L-isoaspartate(D-aspartate) O-methyltransferase